MKLYNKNSNLQSANITFEGGINVSEPSTNIMDNELQECVNLYYANLEKYLTTRMGIKRIDVPTLNTKIEKLYEYNKNEIDSYLVAVSEGKLYYLKSTVVDLVETLSWQQITTLENSTILPSLITYNGNLIIADRGPHLRSWNGTTTTSLSASPPYVTIIEEINGRIVCNSEATGELDAVYFSAPYNSNEWNTNNGAVGLRVGYGQGRRVTGIGVIANDVIVFKENGMTYRVSCQGNVSSWYISKLFSTNSCDNQETIETVGNDLVFGSASGINSVQTVQEYGDLKMNHLGMKVSSMLNGKRIQQATWSTTYGVLFLVIEGSNSILVFHPHLGSYTTFDFGFKVNTICNGMKETYFGDNTGKIYKSTNLSRDELSTGVFTDIHSRMKTKTFLSSESFELVKSRLFLEQIDYTKGYISVFDRTDTEETVLFDWLPNYAGYVYDANYYVYDADMYLYGDALSYFDILNSYYDQAFSFVIDIELGRAKIKSLTTTLSIQS